MKNIFLINTKVQNFLLTNKPKIAILAPSIDTVPSKYGSAIYTIIEDIAYFSKFPIIVFSRYENNIEDCKISDRIIYYCKPIQKTFFQKIIGHRLRKKIYGISATEDIEYARNVFKFCLIHDISCLVVEDSNSLLPGLRKDPKINIILHQHANAMLCHKKFYFKKFVKRLSEIIFVSEINRISVIKKFGNFNIPTITIYNGLDLNCYKQFTVEEIRAFKISIGIDTNMPVLFFAGRIHPSKGIKELLEASKIIEEIDFKLIIAGDLKTNYNYNTEFKNQIKKLAFENSSRVLLAGQISQKQIPFYYAISDFVIVPSIGDEGLPKVITEAVVMGKPVIASNRGGVKELIKDGVNGIIIQDPVNPENISSAIRNAFDKESMLKQKAIEQIQINRDRFSSEKMAEQFDSVFYKYIQ